MTWGLALPFRLEGSDDKTSDPSGPSQTNPCDVGHVQILGTFDSVYRYLFVSSVLEVEHSRVAVSVLSHMFCNCNLFLLDVCPFSYCFARFCTHVCGNSISLVPPRTSIKLPTVCWF